MKVSFKGKNWSYESVLLDNIRALANYIEGKTSTFTLNIPDLELNRVEDVDLRSRIMGMTIAERKELGIRRNTLWYMQKNIRERRIKIYPKVRAKFWGVEMIQEYIKLYLHKRITQNALWQRYTNSRLFLGEDNKIRSRLLADAVHIRDDFYE